MSVTIKNENIQVVIFAGGHGSRLSEETLTKPKPLVEIGGMPILWHIMKNYSAYGFRRFVILIGYKGEVIKQFFLHYNQHKKNLEFHICPDGINSVVLGPKNLQEDWEVRLVETGEKTSTGARLALGLPFIDSDIFCLTYGDGLTDVNFNDEIRFHMNHGRAGTVLGVHPQGRFGEILYIGNEVTQFNEKPNQVTSYINGGFFVFDHRIFNYVSVHDDAMFERKPLEALTRDQGLFVYKHGGFWQCMDTLRDKSYLCQLWEKNPPWKNWD